MLKVFTACGIVLAVVIPSDASTIYVLNGQIASGTSLFQPSTFQHNIPWDEYGMPSSGYPIDYTAQLTLGPGDDWSFEFTALDIDREEFFMVDRSRSSSRASNSFLFSSQKIAIEYFDIQVAGVEFDLNIDLASGTGSWNWRRDCIQCDLAYPLPSAYATVSSMQLAPEPGSGFLLILGGLIFAVTSARRS